MRNPEHYLLFVSTETNAKNSGTVPVIPGHLATIYELGYLSHVIFLNNKQENGK